jgi:hypothetical protein
MRRHVHRLLAPALVGACAAVAAQPIVVKVQKQGELVVVDVDAMAAVEPAIAFAVLTDYDHMASFVSALKSSSMRRTGPQTLEVEQVVEAKVAFMTMTMHSVRAVELVPLKEVRSHLIRGDFKSYEFTTRIAEKTGGTQILHHGEYVPSSWLPPMIGPAVIQSQTEKQYEEMIGEMLRRKASRVATPEGAPSAPERKAAREDAAPGR